MLSTGNINDIEDDVESKASAQKHEFAVSLPNSTSEIPLKLDPHGYPLRPQPSDDSLGKELNV
jgi:hypothetical protein